MKTGVQVSSFRPILKNEAQVHAAFQALHAMGCRYVQLQWIDPSVSPEYIAAALKKCALQAVSVQDFYEDIRKNEEHYLQMCRLCGCGELCVSRIPKQYLSAKGLAMFAQELCGFAQRLQKENLILSFHPRWEDYCEVDGIVPVKYLTERVPGLVLCMDLYHVEHSGRDLRKTIQEFSGCITMVHFKDYVRDENGTETLVPAGQGAIVWDDVVSLCRKAGVAYGFVEQEIWQGDPFEQLGEALLWLKRECDEEV